MFCRQITKTIFYHIYYTIHFANRMVKYNGLCCSKMEFKGGKEALCVRIEGAPM